MTNESLVPCIPYSDSALLHPVPISLVVDLCMEYMGSVSRGSSSATHHLISSTRTPVQAGDGMAKSPFLVISRAFPSCHGRKCTPPRVLGKYDMIHMFPFDTIVDQVDVALFTKAAIVGVCFIQARAGRIRGGRDYDQI